MKRSYLIMAGFLSFLNFSSFSQGLQPLDLHNLVKNKGIGVFNRELSSGGDFANIVITKTD
ncbi:MAG: hypothetical protein ABI741_15380 [Ferruginibacter sp.]